MSFRIFWLRMLNLDLLFAMSEIMHAGANLYSKGHDRAGSQFEKIVKWWKINELVQVLAFLRGELKMTEYSFLKQVGTRSPWIISTFLHFVFPQDNITRCTMVGERNPVAPVSLQQLEEMEKEGKLVLQPLPIVKSPSNIDTVRVKRERKVLTQEEIDALAEKRRMEILEMKELKAKEQQRREEEREACRQKRLVEREERRMRRSMELKMEKEERDELRRIRAEKKEEERKKMKEEMERRREERESKWAEGRTERERKFLEDGPDLSEVAEELRKFMCFICKIFPRYSNCLDV